jgi:zinc protease
MAGTLAGSSGRNSFSLRSEWLARNWEQGFDLMADCIVAPDFASAEIDRERRRVIDELSVRRDDPGFLAIRLFAETLYRRHPYRLDILGTEASVAGLNRKRIISHFRRYLPVSELTLAFVGDVDPARVLERVNARLGAIPRRSSPSRQVPGEEFGSRSAESRRVRCHLDREQAHLVMGFPGTTLADSDRFALEVMTTILGGQGGRLFIELRDRRALAYRVGAMSMEGTDPGYLATYLACSPEKLDEAMTAVRSELDGVADHGVTAAEVERAITYLLGVHEISLQRRAILASAIGFHEAYGLGYDQHRRFAEKISAVGRADVQRVAAHYINWDLAVTASVEPGEDLQRKGREPAGARSGSPARGRAKAARRAR